MLVVADRVKEYTSSNGVGPITLEGPDSTFVSFSSVCANGDEVYYAIVHRSSNEWELGRGTYNNNTISRGFVLSSSTGTLVDFSAGGKDIFLTIPSQVLEIVSKATGPILVGRVTGTEGSLQHLSANDVKSFLNISSSDIQNFVSADANNRAVNSNGVYVPELTLDLVAIYNTAKQ